MKHDSMHKRLPLIICIVIAGLAVVEDRGMRLRVARKGKTPQVCHAFALCRGKHDSMHKRLPLIICIVIAGLAVVGIMRRSDGRRSGLCGESAVLVDVDFYYISVFTYAFLGFFEYGSLHLAGTAPCGEEIDKGRFFFENQFVKISHICVLKARQYGAKQDFSKPTCSSAS